MLGAGKAAPQGAWILLSLLSVFHSCGVGLSHGSGDAGVKAGVKCIEREREALLAVRDDIWGPMDWLSYPSFWEKRVDDCCQWEGVLCDDQSGHVIKLDLYSDGDYRNLSKVSPSLLNLTRLEQLNLGHNHFGGAHIPGFIGSLVNLQYLDLSKAGFAGPIPRQLGALRNLMTLDLSRNSIVGSIPASIGELTSLRDLILSDNKLGGPIPSSIGELFNLANLDISSNRFHGVLSEAHFAKLSHLTVFDMSNNPALSLDVSWAWIPPFQLDILKLRGCQVGPAFPRWLQTQQGLRELDLSNNVISDSLPDYVWSSFPYLRSLNLSHNQIDGILPFNFSSGPYEVLVLNSNRFRAPQLHVHSGSPLVILHLSNNLISGPFSIGGDDDFQLWSLDLSQNNINGSIPLPICQMNDLELLDLSYNHLSGAIPECWNDSGRLREMRFSNNKLLGPIPASLGNLYSLESLHLDKNNLTGGIPSSLRHSGRLVTLNLGDNQLSGELPAWLGESLPQLRVLRLRSNMFHGYIPMSLSQLQSLKVLDLACNRLSGALTLSFSNLSAMVKVENVLASDTVLSPDRPIEENITLVPKGKELEYTTTLSLVTIIDLSKKNLFGQIPEEIACLKGLRFLNLSRNHLEGEIPTHVGTMLQLESLDLSFNQLSGSIPLSMSTMNFLSRFNVSYNNLSGRIPSGSQLRTFDQSSYIGSPNLCGPPLLRPCPDDVTSKGPAFQPSARVREEEHEPYKIWLYIGMGTGFAVGFWGFLGMLLVMQNKRVMYFRLIDYVADEFYVMIVIHSARLKLRISCMHGKPMD